MKFRTAIPLTLLIVAAAAIWRAELIDVSPPGVAPRPLTATAAASRPSVSLDVILPAVPVGMHHLTSNRHVQLIHYWAPWERHSRAQIAALDSLRREPGLERLQVAVVCFDPFPSVARFVARQRVRLAVLLDGAGELRRALPCPSIPYTYVIDGSGRIAIAQSGEVDWWAPETGATLRRLLAEPEAPRNPARL